MLLPTILALALTACSTSTPDPEGSTQQPAEAEATGAAETPTNTPEEASSDEAAQDEGEMPQGDGTETVYLVSMGFQHRFWQAVREGAEQAGDEYGYLVEFVGPEDESQVTQQLNLLQTALDSRPAAIGLAALDGSAAEPLLNEIEAAGIPVVAFDSGVESDVPATTVQTDNVAAAEEAAARMSDLLGGEGLVGLVCHDQTSQVGQQRCNGFRDYIVSNAPGIQLLEPQIANEVGLAANTAKSILQANPDVVGLYATNEAAAAGAVQGAAELGVSDVVIIGFDSGSTQIEAVRSGQAAGAVSQAPVRMGYETVIAAIRAIHGQSLPDVIDSGFTWYDATNIDDPDVAENLYE